MHYDTKWLGSLRSKISGWVLADLKNAEFLEVYPLEVYI